MARTIPDDVWKAIAVHLAESHGIREVDPREVGRPTSRRDTVTVTWQKGSEKVGPSFTCRRCPQGFDRYLVEVYQQIPSDRILALIQAHFDREHAPTDGGPVPRISREEIFYDGNTIKNPKADFMPMTPEARASIICKLCPQFSNRHYLTPLPYGDARRLHGLTFWHPELWQQIGGLTLSEQAEWLDAWDRGEIQREQHAVARQARRRARAAEYPRAPSPLDAALITLMQTRVEAGEKITHIVRDILETEQVDPDALLVELAQTNAGFAKLAKKGSAAEVVEAARGYFGLADRTLPVGERRLWNLWRRAQTAG